MTQRAEQILDIAERLARQGGYDAFSFRDIAAEIGIKSASVHYHFPTKESLGVALIKRYTERLFANLPPATSVELGPKPLLRLYIEGFRAVLEGGNCLGAAMGVDRVALPGSVGSEAAAFFEKNLAWLEAVFTRMGVKDPRQAALQTLALVQGGVLLAVNAKDESVFDAVVAGTLRSLS